MTIGERLSMIRKNNNLLLKQVGELFQITSQTLSRYENDQRTPDNDFLKKYVKHFNLSSDWLLFGEAPIYKTGKESRDVKESFMELSHLITEKEIPAMDIPEKFDFTLRKITDDSIENYLLLLKYMIKYPFIRKGIFQFFLLILKPIIDKNPELLEQDN